MKGKIRPHQPWIREKRKNGHHKKTITTKKQSLHWPTNDGYSWGASLIRNNAHSPLDANLGSFTCAGWPSKEGALLPLPSGRVALATGAMARLTRSPATYA